MDVDQRDRSVSNEEGFPLLLSSRRDTLGFQVSEKERSTTSALQTTVAESGTTNLDPTSSAVHANVTKFEQLNVQASFEPVLRSIAKADINPASQTYTNVSFFEKIEANARSKPELKRVKASAAPPRQSKIFDRVMSFEELEKIRIEKRTIQKQALGGEAEIIAGNMNGFELENKPAPCNTSSVMV